MPKLRAAWDALPRISDYLLPLVGAALVVVTIHRDRGYVPTFLIIFFLIWYELTKIRHTLKGVTFVISERGKGA